MSTGFKFLLVLTLWIVGSRAVVFRCPNDETNYPVSPCNCTVATNTISCNGPDVSVAGQIGTAFKSIVNFNKINSSLILTVKKFEMSNTSLATFDFSQLLAIADEAGDFQTTPVELEEIVLDGNTRLTSIATGTGGKIDVPKIIITNNALWTGGDIWGSFKPTSVTEVVITGNQILTLPDLAFSTLTNLERIDLSNNRMSSMVPRALEVSTPDFASAEKEITINLSYNFLTDLNIAVGAGIGGMRRPTILDLSNNTLVYLSFEKFAPFLYLNFKNALILKGNPFVCTELMNWITDARVLLENRVNGTDCSNDRGWSVFQSGYVSADNGSSGLSLGSGMVTALVALVYVVGW